jgi:hypothetical protein
MLDEGVTVEKLSIGVGLMAQASNPSGRRGPSLLDACVFIAAFGLGLAALRSDEMRIADEKVSQSLDGLFV